MGNIDLASLKRGIKPPIINQTLLVHIGSNSGLLLSIMSARGISSNIALEMSFCLLLVKLKM